MARNHEGSDSSKEDRPSLQPLLRWPGGKRFLLGSLRPLVPSSFRRYFEPFVGGGALYFSLRPQTALLSDTNAELVDCYEALRDHPRAILNRLSGLDNTAETYYRMRGLVPSSPLDRAVRLIYLTRLSFNGIFRVNREGRFNVPIGRRTRDPASAMRDLLAASKALQGTSLLCADFEVAVSTAAKNDFVFLDPPYTVGHENNGFRKYNAKIFSWADQERLANCMTRLDKLGCHLLMTNACHSSITSLYAHFSILRLSRMSCIAAQPEHRRSVQELIITNMI
jgi:DNA adenine methylase